MENLEDYRTASQAKYEYFLTPGDLASLPSSKSPIVGYGNSKIFFVGHLEEFALRKFGPGGLTKKREGRAKRAAIKREREEEVKQVAAALLEPMCRNEDKRQCLAMQPVVEKGETYNPLKSASHGRTSECDAGRRGQPLPPQSISSVDEWKAYGEFATCVPCQLLLMSLSADCTCNALDEQP